jgi:hypothetical protein
VHDAADDHVARASLNLDNPAQPACRLANLPCRQPSVCGGIDPHLQTLSYRPLGYICIFINRVFPCTIHVTRADVYFPSTDFRT